MKKFSSLVLPTEIKKVYCDEKIGTIYSGIVRQLKKELHEALEKTVSFFATEMRTNGKQNNWKTQ